MTRLIKAIGFAAALLGASVIQAAAEYPEQQIHFLSPVVCMCATMYRIDLPHLCWTLENLREGSLVNKIEVDAETSKWSLVALERMLAVN